MVENGHLSEIYEKQESVEKHCRSYFMTLEAAAKRRKGEFKTDTFNRSNLVSGSMAVFCLLVTVCHFEDK